MHGTYIKFTDEQINDMVKLYEEGKSKLFIARQFSVSTSTIRYRLIERGVSIDPKRRVKDSSSVFKKGVSPWNKGLTKETSEIVARGATTLSKVKRGVSQKHNGQFKKGAESPGWKGGITPEDRVQRSRFKHTLQQKILKRDDYTCQKCGDKGTYLHVDHIKKWADYPELRFDMDNCQTLCRGCHYEVTFGKPMPENSRWGLVYKDYPLLAVGA